MQTLKKKNKMNTKILVYLLGFLCCILLGSCNNSEIDEVLDPVDEEVALSESEKELVHSLLNHRAHAKENTVIYQLQGETYQEVGMLSAEVFITVGEDSNPEDRYVALADSEYVLDGTTLTLDFNDRKIENHLLAFNENCITKDNFVIKDEFGNVVMQFHQSQEFVIYVKDATQTGIVFQERIYYIDNEDIMTTKESMNTSEVEDTEVPVLMYHFFYSKENNETGADGNWMGINNFENQLEYLKTADYTSLTMRELELFLDKKARVPENSFVITIDDGHPSVYEYAYPLIKEYGFNATLFLIGGWLDPILPYEFVEMREDGLELQAHSFLLHEGGCNLGKGGLLQCIDVEEGVKDTIQSLEYVDGGFAYCYPLGDHGGNAIEIMQKSGVRLAFTTKPGLVEQGMDKLRLPRVRVSGGTALESFKERLIKDEQ